MEHETTARVVDKTINRRLFAVDGNAEVMALRERPIPPQLKGEWLVLVRFDHDDGIASFVARYVCRDLAEVKFLSCRRNLQLVIGVKLPRNVEANGTVVILGNDD